ncbi:non-hydrolyzing UDP-N-acetylglucosamine 2-epimerase [Aedoeadaptatus coxii]|uniref:non-hydrolyzing UDP-N-acetylglucosamine 2-epimerase n=1 Tax=Aedoeadaptatus coxii TaxID=755172 RepID=UPI002AD3D01C|nr:UDP-N-acetylglucosamine 2-epimerase (non-hydrolyzing) [Peptoniphilus coxii]
MKVLSVFGTRPEAIKMAPIVLELKKRKEIESYVAVTGQHREMLDQVLAIFDIKPDVDLDIFTPGQSLTDIAVRSLRGLEDVLNELKPDLLLVQGDTSTVFAAALSAFYHRIPIGHVEAGLRSHNLYSPYPEEANRKLTGVLAEYHFAPTESNRQNLLKEGYDDEKIYITGNTVIDALAYTERKDFVFDEPALNAIDFDKKRVILLTCHRRENLGEPMERVFRAVRRIADAYDDVEVVFPMHLNPKVRAIAEEAFGGAKNVHRIEPMDYLPFSNLMARSNIVVTDSGGIQEEAPHFGVPVLVAREETERWEGVEAKTAKLVGTDEEKLYSALKALLDDQNAYESMAQAVNPYGDGKAAERIVDIILKDKLK